MPFNLNGDYIPSSKPQQKLQKKIFTEKRRGKVLTIVQGYANTKEEGKELLRTLKQKLATGGSLNDLRVELQGNHLEKVKSLLSSS